MNKELYEYIHSKEYDEIINQKDMGNINLRSVYHKLANGLSIDETISFFCNQRGGRFIQKYCFTEIFILKLIEDEVIPNPPEVKVGGKLDPMTYSPINTQYYPVVEDLFKNRKTVAEVIKALNLQLKKDGKYEPTLARHYVIKYLGECVLDWKP